MQFQLNYEIDFMQILYCCLIYITFIKRELSGNWVTFASESSQIQLNQLVISIYCGVLGRRIELRTVAKTSL